MALLTSRCKERARYTGDHVQETLNSFHFWFYTDPIQIIVEKHQQFETALGKCLVSLYKSDSMFSLQQLQWAIVEHSCLIHVLFIFIWELIYVCFSISWKIFWDWKVLNFHWWCLYDNDYCRDVHYMPYWIHFFLPVGSLLNHVNFSP